MQTYKYRIPIYGLTDTLSEFDMLLDLTAAMLQEKLDDGPDCLASCCIFPTDSAILDHTTFDVNDKGNITAVNLYTYTKLWDGMEDDLKGCVQRNLTALTRGKMLVDGQVEFIDLIKIPDKLYRISSEKNVAFIMGEGILPGQGPNSYRNTHDYVYLCEEKDLAPWLAILKKKDKPVILEIDTKNVAGLEPGRMFKDRAFAPDGYSEWRTKEPVPASAVHSINFTTQQQAELYDKMRDQIALAADGQEQAEAAEGMRRLMLIQLQDQANKPKQEDTERRIMTENLTQQDLKQIIAGHFGKDPETIKFNTSIVIGEGSKRVPVFEGCHMDGEYFYSEDIRQVIKEHFADRGLEMASDGAVKFRMGTRSIGRGSDIPQVIPVFNGCSVEYQEKKLDNKTDAEMSDVKPEPADALDPGVKKGVMSLTDMRRDEQYYSLMEMEDRDLCEMVRAHFESHPTLPGEKAMKDRVNQMLDVGSTYGQPNAWEFSSDEKEKIACLYAETRIRETPLKEGNQYLDFRKYDPSALKRTPVDENGPVSVSQVNVELQKGGAGDIYVLAEQSDGTHRTIGTLPDKFLTNNPMNVDSCDATLELTDYSNGNMKNLKARVIVDTDLMSGDVIDLDDDMLSGLEEDSALMQ